MKKLLFALPLFLSCAHTTPQPDQYTIEWLDDSKEEPMWACVSPEAHKLACRSYADIFEKVLQSFSDDELQDLLHKLRDGESSDDNSGSLDQSENKHRTWETRNQ